MYPSRPSVNPDEISILPTCTALKSTECEEVTRSDNEINLRYSATKSGPSGSLLRTRKQYMQVAQRPAATPLEYTVSVAEPQELGLDTVVGDAA